ncbi:MAG: DUF1003 domain-containing protein [archaeon]
MNKAGIKQDFKQVVNDLKKPPLAVQKPIQKINEGIFTTLSKKVHSSKREKLTLGQITADFLTKWAGSWIFIILFFVFIAAWMAMNTYFWFQYKSGDPFDPFPFILLNLILSCLAAIQAPVILMSQNRQAQKDRLKAEYDYQVNRTAEKEIREIKTQLDRIERRFRRR